MDQTQSRNRNPHWRGSRYSPAAAVPCPCMGCADRSAGCHGACRRYAAYRSAADEAAQADKEARRAARLAWAPGRD